MKLSPYAHHLIIEGEMIIFDELNDKYWVLSKEQTDLAIKSLKGEELCHEFIYELLQCNVLILDGNQEKLNFASSTVKKTDNHEWSQSYKIGRSTTKSSLLLQSLVILTLISLGIKIFGIHRMLKMARRLKRNRLFPDTSINRKILDISSAMKQAVRFVPFQVVCLQHSLGTCILAALHGTRVDIKIGVKNYDFLAHAWVESQGRVIGDFQDLPEKLYTICTI